MRIATDQHRSSTVGARCINSCVAEQSDLITLYLDPSACRTCRADGAGDFGALRCFEYDLAALHRRAVCADCTAVAHHGAEQAEATGLGDELSDVGGIARQGGDVDSEIGVGGADQIYA